MAIQKVNLGAPMTGAGGDKYRDAHEKINSNFEALDSNLTTLAEDSLNTKNTLNSADALTINSNKNYPLRAITRDGIMSESQALDVFLDASVINAKPDYYYAIRYFRNGSIVDGAPSYGWSVIRSKKDTYSTASVEEDVIKTSDPAPAIMRDGIQTIFLSKASIDEVIKLTINTTNLKAEGDYYRFNTPEMPLWSWIIDESTYTLAAPKIEPPLPPEPEPMEPKPLAVVLVDGTLSYSYASADRDYRVTIRPNGYNGLPNIYTVESKQSSAVDWDMVTATASDWLPPLRAKADAGDLEFTDITTGGNHGKDGGSGGGQTARNIYYAINIDGKKQTTFDGDANNIKVTIINEVMAANTVSVDRYAVRECFVLDIDSSGLIRVNCDRRALESLVMTRDRGLQAVLGAFDATYIVLGGTDKARLIVPSTGFDGGTKAQIVNADAVVYQNNYDQLSVDIDSSYALGDKSQVANSQQLFFGSGGVSKKHYSAIIASTSLQLNKGDGYQWRGSYQIKAATDKPISSDSELDAYSNRIIAYDADDYMIV